MVSIAQGLRMMGGGKDTSGYADMLDAMEVRDLLGERRAAEAATQQQQELMDYWKSLYGDTGDTGDTGEETIPGTLSESEALSINMDALKADPDYDDLADVPEYLKVHPAVGTGEGLLEGLPVDARGDYAGDDPNILRSGAKNWLTGENLLETLLGFPGFMISGAFDAAKAPMTQGEIEDFYTGNESTGAEDLLYSGYGHLKHRNEFDLQEGDTNIHGNKVVMDSPMYDADSPYNDPNFWENYNKADGGRVGMFLGGTTASGTVQPNPGAQPLNQSGIGGALIGLINQNPQIQQQLQGLNQQNYNLPTQVQNQMYTPPQAQPQQGWNPYVSAGPAAGSMGFYDPSTLDMPVSNEPVMLGGPDPYQMVDPYVTPQLSPYSQGPRPADQYGIGLSQADITDAFSDMDKYSLEAQRRKAEAAAAAKKPKYDPSREHQGPKYDSQERQRRVHHGGGNGGAP